MWGSSQGCHPRHPRPHCQSCRPTKKRSLGNAQEMWGGVGGQVSWRGLNRKSSTAAFQKALPNDHNKLPVPARTQHVPAQSELPQYRALGCRHGAMAPLALTAGWIQPRPAGGAANATSSRAGRPLALATCCSGTRTRPGDVLPTAPVREHYEPLPAAAAAAGASPQPRLLLRG